MNFSFSFVEWTILLTTALLNVTSCHDKFILRAHQLCLEIGNLPSINMSKYMQCLADSHMFQPAFTDRTVNKCTCDEKPVCREHRRDENMYAVRIGDENLASIAAVGHLRHADEDQVCFCAVLLFLSFGIHFLGLLKVRVLDLNLS